MTDTPPLVRSSLASVLVAVLLGGLFYLGGNWIERQDFLPATVTVTGEGRVFGAPDIALLVFGVQTGRRSTAKEAIAMVDKMIAAGVLWFKVGLELLTTLSGAEKVIKYLLVGQRVWQLAFSPDEAKLFTTNGVSNDVSVIDVKNMKVIKSIAVGRYPWGVAVKD